MSVTKWIQEKLAEAKRHLASRISMEESWRGGTQKDWEAASRLSGTKMLTQQQRIEEAERQKRISDKCRDEVAMWKEVAGMERQLAERDAQLEVARTALDTIGFHLRRNDHVTPPTGDACTRQLIDAIHKALARIDAKPSSR